MCIRDRIILIGKVISITANLIKKLSFRFSQPQLIAGAREASVSGRLLGFTRGADAFVDAMVTRKASLRRCVCAHQFWVKLFTCLFSAPDM